VKLSNVGKKNVLCHAIELRRLDRVAALTVKVEGNPVQMLQQPVYIDWGHCDLDANAVRLIAGLCVRQPFTVQAYLKLQSSGATSPEAAASPCPSPPPLNRGDPYCYKNLTLHKAHPVHGWLQSMSNTLEAGGGKGGSLKMWSVEQALDLLRYRSSKRTQNSILQTKKDHLN
jgi:hypothetical protein